MAVFAGCADRAPATINGVVTFAAGEAMLNDKAAQMGCAVKQGDRLLTKSKSAMTVQFGAIGILALRENSEIVVEKSISKNGFNEINLSQKVGNTFHKLTKGQGTYTVVTPTAVASVRGTSFGISITEEGKTGVKLLSGSLAVKPAEQGVAVKDKPETVLASGQMVEAARGGLTQPSPIAESEKKELEVLDHIEIIPLEKLPEFQQKKQGVIAPPVIQVLTGSGDAQTVKVTLAEIRSKFGPLSKVKLKSGQEYIGAFRQLGGTMEIITVQGKVRVPSANVDQVLPY